MQLQRQTLTGKLRCFHKESSCCSVNTSAYLMTGLIETENERENTHVDSENVQ